MKQSIQDRVYEVLIESNRKLAGSIVKEGRRQQCSNAVILQRVREFSKKKVTALCAKHTVSTSIREQTTRPPSGNLLRRMIKYLHF